MEIARSEHYFGLRLREQPIPSLDESYPISATRQPRFEDLEAVWEPQMHETRVTLERITDWGRPVTCEIRWPDRTITLTATKSAIVTQLLLHDLHHRAQAMAMLRQLGVPAQDLDYIGFVQERHVRGLDASSERTGER